MKKKNERALNFVTPDQEEMLFETDSIRSLCICMSHILQFSAREQVMRTKPSVCISLLLLLFIFCLFVFTCVLNIILIWNYVDRNGEVKFTRKLKKLNSKKISSMAWNGENCDTIIPSALMRCSCNKRGQTKEMQAESQLYGLNRNGWYLLDRKTLPFNCTIKTPTYDRSDSFQLFLQYCFCVLTHSVN